MTKRKIIFMATCFCLLFFLSFFLIQKWQRDHAVIEVELKKEREVEVYHDVYVKDFIKKINGQILENKKIDTSEIGRKKATFSYRNDQKIRVSYTFEVKITDKTAPLIRLGEFYTVPLHYDGDITRDIFCGDNYDDAPSCQVIGSYNIDEIGEYPLLYQAEDKSGNKSEQAFTLKVVEKIPTTKKTTKTLFEEALKKYKNDQTEIGIDVSHWQGDIDFQKVKEAGCSFAFVRVGSRKKISGEYVLDKKFLKNMEGFKKVGIPVGVYFYSYAKNEKEAKKDALWVMEQVKDYDLALPIVYDWENWSFYQEFQLSFYHLTSLANAFLDTVHKKGYEGMLYSSKNYLETVWYKTKYKTWLAHYTSETNYLGPYKVWQLCEDGKIDGIKENVDINVLYKNEKNSSYRIHKTKDSK